jgi:hypothetical protein
MIKNEREKMCLLTDVAVLWDRNVIQETEKKVMYKM